jgi:dTDP-L-rhamnose 4-epimerase
LHRGVAVRVVDNLEPRVHPRGRPAYVPAEADFLAGDLRDRSTTEQALEGVEVVFHQAAYQDYMPDYSKFFHSNVVSTGLLYEVIREKRLPVRKVIVASSQSVYGEGQYRCPEHGFCQPPPRSLEQLDRGQWNLRCPRCGAEMEPILLREEHANPASPYGVSKYSQELTALRLGRLLGIPTVALRYSITQGARQSFYNAYSGICRIFTRALLAGQAPVVYEDGMQQRDYVHIDDVISANLLVLDRDETDYESFNVGSATAVTVLDYARRLAKKMGVEVEPNVLGAYRVGDVRHTVSSHEKLARFGWRISKGLEEIFTDYLGWLQTVEDRADYFTPALEQMTRGGIVRHVQRNRAGTAVGKA